MDGTGEASHDVISRPLERGFQALTGLHLGANALAGVLGSRFGGEKLTSLYKDGVLLDGALFAAFAAPVQRVVVVTGADPKVTEAAKAFAARTGDERLELVYAERHAEGLSASLRAGLEARRPEADGFYVFLGDMPRVPVAVLREMSEALDHGAIAVAPVFHGRRGHPVLFSPALLDELMELEGDKGANGLLDGLGERLVTVVAPDDGVLFDVDTKNPAPSSDSSEGGGA